MNELTDERLAELRTIAEGAESQEPWRTDDDEGRMVFAASGFQVYYALFGSNNGDAEPGDAAHIAAFDPPTVLALLDRLEAAEAKVARVEELCEWADDRGSVWSGVLSTRRIREALAGEGS